MIQTGCRKNDNHCIFMDLFLFLFCQFEPAANFTKQILCGGSLTRCELITETLGLFYLTTAIISSWRFQFPHTLPSGTLVLYPPGPLCEWVSLCQWCSEGRGNCPGCKILRGTTSQPSWILQECPRVSTKLKT